MVIIKVNLEGIAFDQGGYAPPVKPTYKNIKQWIFDKYDFNVSTLYIAQIKDKVGMRSGRIIIRDQDRESFLSVSLMEKKQLWMPSGILGSVM